MKKLIYLIAPAILLSACWLQGMKEEEIVIVEQPVVKKQVPQKKQEHVQPTLSVELLPTDKKNEYFIKFLDQLIPTTMEFLQQCEAFESELHFFSNQSVSNKDIVATPGPRKIVWDITQLIGLILDDLENLLLYNIDENLNPQVRHALAQEEIIKSFSCLFDTTKDLSSFDQHKLFALIKIANLLKNSHSIQRFASPLIFQLTPAFNIPSLRTFKEHTKNIWQIILIPGTTQFLSSSWDGTIKLWDLNNTKSLRTFKEYSNKQVILIPGTTQFLSGSGEGTINLWDLNNPTSLRTFKEHHSWIDQFVLIPGTTRFMSGSDDGTIKLWDWNKTKSLRTFNEHQNRNEHPDRIEQVVLIPGTMQFLSSSHDKTINLWDLNNPTSLRTFNEHHSWIEQFVLIPGTTQFLSSSWDGTIKLWDLNNPTSLRTFNEYKYRVKQVVLIPGTTQFLSGSADHTIKLWDWNKTKSLRTFNEHDSWIEELVLIPGTTQFISCSGDDTIKLWDWNNPKSLRTFKEHTERINHIILIPGTTQFLSDSDDNTIKLWDWNNPKSLRTFKEHTKRINHIVIIPGTTQFLSDSDDNTIKLWDYAPFKKLTFPQLELCYKIFTSTKPYTLLRTTGDYELFMSLPKNIRDEAIKLKKVKLPFKAQTQPGQRPFTKPGKKK